MGGGASGRPGAGWAGEMDESASGRPGRAWPAGVAAVLVAVMAALGWLGGRHAGEPPARPRSIRADDPRLFESPWVWQHDGSARQTTHFGASIRFGWTGRNLGLNVD